MGRPGAFFVHALVWRAGIIAPQRLAGLWDARVWVTAPPEDPPARLEPFEGIDALGLGPARRVDEHRLATLLGGHLANAAAGRGSCIGGAPGDAMALAAQVAAGLPAQYGLPAFSTLSRSGGRGLRHPGDLGTR